MNEKDVNDFINGKASLVPKPDGTFAIEPLSSEHRCPICNRLINSTTLRFRVGQKVLCDYIDGTSGRCVAEGVIKEIKNNYWYFVLQDDGFYHWRRDCELKELIEI